MSLGGLHGLVGEVGRVVVVSSSKSSSTVWLCYKVYLFNRMLVEFGPTYFLSLTHKSDRFSSSLSDRCRDLRFDCVLL